MSTCLAISCRSPAPTTTSWTAAISISSVYTSCIRAKSYFVTRSKRNFNFKRRYSHEVDKTTGVQCDQTIVLKTYYSSQGYPESVATHSLLRCEFDKRLTFLTNDFSVPATTIAATYKSRWRIELFFKWIKQHLRIKSFYGTGENASQNTNLDRRGNLPARGDHKKGTRH